MPYIYQADLWCDECGLAIRARLQTDGTAGQYAYLPENAYDSDDYPKYVAEVGESDTVDHCASGETCINAEVFPSGRRIGAWLENDLTSDGVAWLNDQITDPHNSGNEVVRYWSTLYHDLEPWPDDLPAPYFDRFDVCEAYAVLEWHWNQDGWLRERPSNARRMEATSVQLARIQFRAAPSLEYRSLSENGKAIYWHAARRFGLVR